jgi:GMP synthase-like glutamine amidotransferase
MRVLLICHEPHGSPGVIGRLLRERGVDTQTHIVLEDPASPNTAFPDPGEFDAVISFGSFCNAYDPSVRTWVEPGVALISDMVERDIPYLGVCFGGQLLAEALGGSVERAPAGTDEIGLIHFDSAIPEVPGGPWFSWHEDRTTLPDHVTVLGRNQNAPQLFRHGRAVGTQFHPEAEIPLVRTWTEMGADHIPERTSAVEILDDLDAQRSLLESNCARLVDWFLEDVARGR